MLPNFASQSRKAEYLRIRKEVDRHLDYRANPINEPHSEQAENRIFHFIDAELGVQRTPSEARIYKKLIKQLSRTKMLNIHYIRALEKKANKFLDKKSMQKEK